MNDDGPTLGGMISEFHAWLYHSWNDHVHIHNMHQFLLVDVEGVASIEFREAGWYEDLYLPAANEDVWKNDQL